MWEWWNLQNLPSVPDHRFLLFDCSRNCPLMCIGSPVSLNGSGMKQYNNPPFRISGKMESESTTPSLSLVASLVLAATSALGVVPCNHMDISIQHFPISVMTIVRPVLSSNNQDLKEDCTTSPLILVVNEWPK